VMAFLVAHRVILQPAAIVPDVHPADLDMPQTQVPHHAQPVHVASTPLLPHQPAVTVLLASTHQALVPRAVRTVIAVVFQALGIVPALAALTMHPTLMLSLTAKAVVALDLPLQGLLQRISTYRIRARISIRFCSWLS
jgi:hypothetical protein